MGFVANTCSYTPYQVAGDKGPANREGLLKGLTRGRLTPIDVDLGHDNSTGFAVFDDPLDTEFTEEKVFFDPLVLFCLRIDKLTVPPSTLRLHVRSRVNAVLTATGRARMPRTERDEIAEQVRGELLRRALPTISAYEVVWDTSTGRVRLYSSSQTVNEDFATRFRDDIGVGLTPMNTVGILETHFKPDDMEKVYRLVPSTFVAVNPGAGLHEGDDQ
ncbi:MAG: recombination-associated protein RdgC [Deltaproteobacteria bacterium]|nr:recombination-associated protein RdgC [Deltaproteobacteria bacterium]